MFEWGSMHIFTINKYENIRIILAIILYSAYKWSRSFSRRLFVKECVLVQDIRRGVREMASKGLFARRQDAYAGSEWSDPVSTNHSDLFPVEFKYPYYPPYSLFTASEMNSYWRVHPPRVTSTDDNCIFATTQLYRSS